jgi:hypothetical protein
LKFINATDTTDFLPGQMVVYEIATGTYKFVIYIKDHDNIGNKLVYTRNTTSNDIIAEKVHRSSLKHYSKHEPITQTIKNGMAFSENDLLEIYTC